MSCSIWMVCYVFPQQRKLMGSSAQISSRCGSEEQVPEEGSRRFRRVPVCAGVGSGGRFRKVPEGSSVCWCSFRRQLPEGSGGFRRVPVFRKVQESSGVVSCLATLTGAAMWLFLNPFWWWHCPHGQNHCGTRMRPCSQTWQKATAVGDTTKAYFVPGRCRFQCRRGLICALFWCIQNAMNFNCNFSCDPVVFHVKQGVHLRAAAGSGADFLGDCDRRRQYFLHLSIVEHQKDKTLNSTA